MSLLNYIVFIDVYDNQSFARAADHLHMSPSAVSHAVAKLEDEMGFPMLVRGRNELTLTKEGELVIGDIRNIVNSENLIQEKIMQVQGLTRGEVRIGAISTVSMSWLPDILEEYSEKYPDVRIHVQQNGYVPLRDAVFENRLDIAFIALSAIGELDTSYIFTPLYDDPLVLVAPDGMHVTKNKFVSKKDLAKLTFIEYDNNENTDTKVITDEAANGSGHSFSAMYDSAILEMVRRGFGCAVMPDLCTRTHDMNGLTVHKLKDERPRRLGMLTKALKFQSPATKKMTSLISEYISKL